MYFILSSCTGHQILQPCNNIELQQHTHLYSPGSTQQIPSHTNQTTEV
jgi:hypothetical protein